MSKYNIGDKVVVKKSIACGVCYGMDGEANKECLVTPDMAAKAGKVVTISNVRHLGSYTRYYIEEDKWNWVDGMFEGLAKEKKAVNDKIVILHDGKTTTATMYCEDGTKKVATARCAPEDTFDFNVGAKLAMERLMEKVEPNVKQLNVKFKTGDYARIVDRKHGHEFEIGTIVRLEKFETDYKARADGNYWWVLDDELEAYTPPKYYNGKVVCVNDCDLPSDLTVGKIYEFVDGRCENNIGTQITNGPVTDVNDLNSRFRWAINCDAFIPLVE